MELDEKDKKILILLKENSSLTVNQISKKTKVPITTVHNRIKKLKETGIIKNYTINLDYEKIGKPIKSYVLITVNQDKTHPQEKIAKKIKEIEDILSVDIITGTNDLISIVKTDSIKNLNEIITQKIRNIEGVDKTQTIIVLNEIN